MWLPSCLIDYFAQNIVLWGNIFYNVEKVKVSATESHLEENMTAFHIDPFARVEVFRALKLSREDSFRALKPIDFLSCCSGNELCLC